MEQQTKRSPLGRYLMSLLAPAVICSVMLLTWPLFEANPVSLYLLAVMFCAWYGGLGPGLSSVLISILLSDYFLIAPYFSLSLGKHNDLVRLLVLGTIGPVMSYLTGLMHRERRRAENNLEATKRAEQASLASETKFRQLLDSSITGVVFWSLQGPILNANDLFLDMVGYTREDLRRGHLSWKDLTPPEYVDVDEKAIRELVATGACSPFEKEYIRNDGSRVSVLLGSALFDSNGTGSSFVMDITDRKRIEEKLRQSERQLAEAQSLASVGSWNWDILSDTHTWSDELYHIYGLHPQESDSSYEAFISLVHPDDRAFIIGVIEDALRNREPINSYVRIIRPDGAERIIHSRGTTISDINGIPIRMYGTVQDVTERKQAEEALREAERKYRDIFENAGEGIFQSTPDGRYLSANPALAYMHGFDSPEELIRNRRDITHEIYVNPTRREEFKRLLEQDGVVRGFEHQIFRKDGSKIWISVNARAVRDNQGKIAYYEGTSQDITERKLAEQRLRESEERYRELFENAKDALYVHDLNGKYISVNRAAEKLSGLSREEILGKTFIDFVPPEQLELVRDHLYRKLIDEGESTYEAEVISKDGRRIPVEVNSHLIYENGVGVGVQGTARDITERKRAEERLREYEKVVEGVEEMIVVVDRDYRYLIANRAFLNHRALKREEVVGHLVPELMGADIFEQIVKKHLDECFKGHIVKYEMKFTYPIGERDLSVAYFPIEGKAGIDRAACVLKDITEQKRAEAALRNYSRLLIEAQEAERQSIARELHDQIGQVLTAIRINLQAIRESCETSESKALIDEGTGIVDQALEQVRNLSFELRPSLLDDLGLVAALRWYADRYAQRTGIQTTTTVTNLHSGQLRLAEELETACFRIVQESLTNVARHAQAKNVLINLGTLNDRISLTIKDDGIGFDKHSRNAASPHPLGLRGMEERALALGGKLEINSAPSQGTEICAHFPNGHKRK
jgi:PAS domain S-box-containing protein